MSYHYGIYSFPQLNMNWDYEIDDLLDDVQRRKEQVSMNSHPVEGYFDFIGHFATYLAADKHPKSKITVKTNFDNVKLKKYFLKKRKSYKFLPHKVYPWLVIPVMLVLMYSIVSRSESGVSDSIEYLLMLTVATPFLFLAVQLLAFGAPVKYNDDHHQLTLLEIKTRLYDGIQIQFKVAHVFLRLDRLRKRLKLSKFSITKHIFKRRFKQVLSLRVDLPQQKYQFSENALTQFFTPDNVSLRGKLFDKVKVKSSPKKHTIMLHFSESNTYDNYGLQSGDDQFPDLNLHEALEMVTKGIFQRLVKLQENSK